MYFSVDSIYDRKWNELSISNYAHRSITISLIRVIRIRMKIFVRQVSLDDRISYV
jgi:hypothetical protein